MNKKKTKAPTSYIDNITFSNSLIEYKRLSKEHKASGFVGRPQIPEYLGKCFLMIAEHLSYSPKFISYSYRDEMVSDGVENCLMYLENFNPDAISKNKKGNNFGNKTKGPFPYFTMIIYYAFLRRIHKEKKQHYVKAKSMENFHASNEITIEDLETLGKVDSGQFKYKNSSDLYSNISEFIANFEEVAKSKKDKKSLLKKIA